MRKFFGPDQKKYKPTLGDGAFLSIAIILLAFSPYLREVLSWQSAADLSCEAYTKTYLTNPVNSSSDDYAAFRIYVNPSAGGCSYEKLARYSADYAAAVPQVIIEHIRNSQLLAITILLAILALILVIAILCTLRLYKAAVYIMKNAPEQKLINLFWVALLNVTPLIAFFISFCLFIETAIERASGAEFALRFVIFGVITIIGIGIATWRSLIAEKEREIAKDQHKTAEERRLDAQFTAALDGLSKELNQTNYPLHISSIRSLGALARNGPSLERCQRVIDTLCSLNEWMKEYSAEKEFLEKLNEGGTYSLRQLSINNAVCSLGNKSITSEDLLREQRSQAAIRGVAGIMRYLAKDHLSILRRLDFSNKVLCGINLSGLKVPDNDRNRRLDFSNAYLQGADLGGAKLWNARLSGANLQEADMAGIFLQNAYLDKTNLQGANLAKARLQGVNLRSAKMHSADLRGARMEFANLFNSNFMKANLSYVNLRGAIMVNINLNNANIKQVSLHGAILLKTNLEAVKGTPQIPNIFVSDVMAEDVSMFKDSEYGKMIDKLENASIFDIQELKIKDDNSIKKLKNSYKITSSSVDYNMEKIPWLGYIEISYPALYNQLRQLSDELYPEQESSKNEGK